MKYSLGIDIGGTKCAVILGDPAIGADQKDPVRRRIAFSTKETGGPEEALEIIFHSIDRILEEEHLTTDDIMGIGVSCGGPLDSEKGVILNPPNLPGWIDVPVCEILNQSYGLPVALENDANACAIAEWKFGAARGAHNVVFLTFGTGMGAGLILNDRLYRGACGLAGEVGHIRLSELGPVGFGKSGSFEGFCSGGGIAELARIKTLEKLQQGEPQNLCGGISELGTLTAKSVAEAALAGDGLAKEIYALSGKYLGKGLSLLIDILNPDIIVLGSIFERSGRLLWPEAERVIREEVIPASGAACKIVPAQLGDSIGDYAALSLAMYHFGAGENHG